jgi:hypothetical protein
MGINNLRIHPFLMNISIVDAIALQRGKKTFLKYLHNVLYQNQSGRGKKNASRNGYLMKDETPSSRFM